jgi:hypothetical protein
MDKPGAAIVAHQTPKAKKKTRLKAVTLSDTRFTEVIVTLCSLKVNPPDFSHAGCHSRKKSWLKTKKGKRNNSSSPLIRRRIR